MSSLDEITVNWEENGEPRVRELKRHVLGAQGSWATLVFLFEEKTGDGWRGPKVQIRRYQKRRNGWVFHSKFIVPNEAEARELAKTLTSWCETPPDEPVAGA